MKNSTEENGQNRRSFLKSAATGTAGIIAASMFPTIVPASVFGKFAPSNRINIGQIGIGRIATTHDLPEVLKNEVAHVMAVADLDKNRLAQGKKWIEKKYADKTGKANYVDVKAYDDYKELLANKEIDAVIISTPDHWHAQPAMEAAVAGKHIYMQKPTSLTIKEGRMMAEMIKKKKVVFQLGSQQRSMNPWPQFKRTCELVRNGRIGKLKKVYVGLPGDPAGGNTEKMPVPANLNYDMWLGSTPEVYYTLDRVHSQTDINDRPGWLRLEQFGAGMITGWGSHHIDIAHWGMDTELTGPIEIDGKATFPAAGSGLWNVHGDFLVNAKYANGVEMEIGGTNPNGVKFEGTDGWIFVSRGNVGVTASDPGAAASAKENKAFYASDPKILGSVIQADEIHLYESPEQHQNWLESIQNGKQTISHAEIAQRSCSACLIAHTAMKLGRKLKWDPKKEEYIGDKEANETLSRPQRGPYGTNNVKG
ncbi:Gfo/Idh/MocA family protein [Dyadobacter fanqingshengii]|uniref:Gfo/Idh/MocA family oxidoreductase n=1 Tax=Dyadobacter fanqingshengii TaxID=2906443 RepID=A0A9X1P7W5_9BACT|nr:Gfo/Idh/MocA family oxidoreductase [Dyadobacter fanqingshengii]MCF0038813.1 Gfo/Idh/MocA family oxidoreductase [Dyadobacter fanqingshengii]USJ34359.1 Gfo/Idh/MocA family oxidoreductase [Dyadobacter fanqingshengii]